MIASAAPVHKMAIILAESATFSLYWSTRDLNTRANCWLVCSVQKIAISDSELVHRLVKTAKIEAVENASREELFSSEIGITSAQSAIAETGTLVLESGAERHRLVSLVPPVHVCVLPARSIRGSMAEILELADTDAHRTITFITGASRTSDIELTLAIGVHGPGKLYVIVIKDQ